MHYKVPVLTSIEVLTNVSLNIAETPLERSLLIDFKTKAASVTALEQEILGVEERILLLSYMGGPFATLKCSFLRNRISRLERKIVKEDKKLEKYAQAEPLQKIISRSHRQYLRDWKMQHIPGYGECMRNHQSDTT